MNKKEAIEQLKSLREHCDAMEYEIFKKDVEAIDYIMKHIQELQKGQNSLMDSKKKWKRKYYKEKRKSKDLQMSVDQIYEDYQDIGKMFFALDEKVGAVKVICKQKYYDLVLEDMTNLILDMLGGNENEERNKNENLGRNDKIRK